MLINTKTKILIARFSSTLICLIRSLFGLGSVGQFKRKNLFWSLDLKEGIDFSIFLLGAFEPKTQRLYCRILKECTQAVVFDIGANIGSHTLPLAELVCPNGGHVIAFEPTIWAIEKLQRNLELNPRLKNGVIIEHAMVVEDVAVNPGQKQSIYSSWPLHNNKKNLLHPVHGGQLHDIGKAKMIQLDDYVDKSSLSNITLIKVDVDGYEPQVIAGAWRTIEKFKPDILMEWTPHLFQNQPRVMEMIIERFLDLHYNLFHADTFKKLTLKKINNLTPKHGSLNILLSQKKVL
jgi:FkbM family methyltransferase